jgi:hypothetical protein
MQENGMEEKVLIIKPLRLKKEDPTAVALMWEM